MLARLEQALERERGFVAETGHELRTPLALLRAELDYALHYADREAGMRARGRRAAAMMHLTGRFGHQLAGRGAAGDGNIVVRTPAGKQLLALTAGKRTGAGSLFVSARTHKSAREVFCLSHSRE